MNRLAAYLRKKDLIAICYLPDDPQSTVFLLYPSRSATFGFLDNNFAVNDDVVLRIAVRARFLPFDQLPSPSPTDASRPSQPQLPGTREEFEHFSDSMDLFNDPTDASRPSRSQLSGSRQKFEHASDSKGLSKDPTNASRSHPQFSGAREKIEHVSDSMDLSKDPTDPSRPSHPQLSGTREKLEHISDSMDLSKHPTDTSRPSHPQLSGTREKLEHVSDSMDLSKDPTDPSRPPHPQLSGTPEKPEHVSDSMDLSKDLSTLNCFDTPEKPKLIEAHKPSSSPPNAMMVAPPDGGQSNAKIDLDSFFRDRFRITFDDLATVHLSKGTGVAGMAFLMFSAEHDEELTLVSEYLRRHEVVIFSSRLSEDWERFAKVVKEGIVLVSYNN